MQYLSVLNFFNSAQWYLHYLRHLERLHFELKYLRRKHECGVTFMILLTSWPTWQRSCDSRPTKWCLGSHHLRLVDEKKKHAYSYHRSIWSRTSVIWNVSYSYRDIHEVNDTRLFYVPIISDMFFNTTGIWKTYLRK